MKGMRMERVQEEIRRELSDILLNRAHDPRLRWVSAQAVSQSRPAWSSRMRISSATDSAGWVSFICTATRSGSCVQSAWLFRNRATMSCSEQLTMKYCCRNRSTRPASVESSGYSTRVSDSAATFCSTAPAKSPFEKSPKSNDSGAAAAHSRSVLMHSAP